MQQNHRLTIHVHSIPERIIMGGHKLSLWSHEPSTISVGYREAVSIVFSLRVQKSSQDSQNIIEDILTQISYENRDE